MKMMIVAAAFLTGYFTAGDGASPSVKFDSRSFSLVAERQMESIERTWKHFKLATTQISRTTDTYSNTLTVALEDIGTTLSNSNTASTNSVKFNF